MSGFGSLCLLQWAVPQEDIKTTLITNTAEFMQVKDLTWFPSSYIANLAQILAQSANAAVQTRRDDVIYFLSTSEDATICISKHTATSDNMVMGPHRCTPLVPNRGNSTPYNWNKGDFALVNVSAYTRKQEIRREILACGILLPDILSIVVEYVA